MSTIRPTWAGSTRQSCRGLSSGFPSAYAIDIRGCNDNVVPANQEFRLSPSRLHTGSAVARQLLAAEEVVGRPASILPTPSGNSRALPLKHGDRMNFSIRTRMIRSGKAAQRFISRTVKPYRAPREHYAFIADCIHR
jgi:hypothetical protein